MKCPKCGNEFTSNTCPVCGYNTVSKAVSGQYINDFQQAQTNQAIQVNSPKKNNIGLIIGLSVAGALVLFTIIGVVLFSTLFKADKDISKTPSSSDIQTVGTPLNSQEIEELYNDPGQFRGRTVTITGEIFSNPKYSDDKIEFSIFADPKNSDRKTKISYNDTDTQVEKGDFVSVTGVIDEIPKNLGEEKADTTPYIKAKTLTTGTYDKVIDPTIKEALIQTPWQAQYGYIIQIDKIELGKTETRVYVKLQNNGIDEFKVYPLTAKLTQNSINYSCETNYIANYPSLESTLLPDAQSEGILTFPPIAQEDFKIVFDTFIGDDSARLKPFEFEALIR